jgi:folylpolyglutamate synthase/dihydropteroate synthase
MPGYFRFVTLLAFHAFLESKVDATILEVGVGGTYDSTNVVPKPIVTGISALGIDHVAVLGKTLEDIAWQKSGINKVGGYIVIRSHISQTSTGRGSRSHCESARISSQCAERESEGA